VSDIAIRPLRAAEFDEWRARSLRNYTDNMIEAGGIDTAAANEKAAADFAQLLGAGIETPGHSVYAIDDGAAPRGSLWLAERDTEQGRALFVYEVFVDADARGRGLGREAMVFAEEEARRRGIDAVALNVFGGNEVARGLYRSLGYREVAVFMRKEL
jgi:ribosomal protein S18 acetylase RimI-like enzyme